MKTYHLGSAWLIAVLTALVFFVAPAAPAAAEAGYFGSITLDLNPSVELIFANGIVTGVTAYNDDGQIILEGVDLQGLSAEESLQAMLLELSEEGYFSMEGKEPYLLITSSGEDQEDGFADSLKDTAKTYLDQLGTSYTVESAEIDHDVSAQAAELSLSAGRYVMMRYIAENQGISIEEAISAYGSTDLDTLMEQFEGLNTVFEPAGTDENSDDSQDPDANDGTGEAEDPDADSNTDDSQDPDADDGTGDAEEPDADSNTDDSQDPDADNGTGDAEDPDADGNADDSQDPDTNDDDDDDADIGEDTDDNEDEDADEEKSLEERLQEAEQRALEKQQREQDRIIREEEHEEAKAIHSEERIQHKEQQKQKIEEHKEEKQAEQQAHLDTVPGQAENKQGKGKH